ncbi:MAG: methyltransferase [Kiloniellales bacterium]|nr:methyltransferase [Kiloniellales bacterium]
MTKLKPQKSFFFEGQIAHLAALAVLLLALYLASGVPGFHAGAFLDHSTAAWAGLAVANAILHQVYVWLCWRLELQGRHLTRLFGNHAFRIYQAGFAVLILLRPVLAFALGWANRGTLAIDPWLGYAISFILLAPSFYLLYCVHRYFGMDRAFGIDHFDASYRNAPLVRQGIFKWTPNAMYVFGFLILWVPGFLFQSLAALIVAAFSHAYIWVHYACTEKPDMRRIYG